MTWRSTRCIGLPLLRLPLPLLRLPLPLSLRLQLVHDDLGLAFGPPLPVESRTERVEDSRQVRQQVFRSILSLVHDFNGTSLCREQRVQVAEAKARQAVLVLYDNQPDTLIGEQLQQLGPRIVDTLPGLL